MKKLLFGNVEIISGLIEKLLAQVKQVVAFYG